MTKILNHINTYADLTAYNADTNKDYPNVSYVSYIEGTDEVKWNKYDPDHIVCVYNVTSTSEATKLCYTNSGISYQIIDGVQQDTLQIYYTFDTLGEHIVKYKLSNVYIASSIFKNCTSLISVTIPSGVTHISSECFYGSSNITRIILPSSITVISNSAFNNCRSLTSVTIQATTPPGIGRNVFENTNNCPIYVPAESLETYKTTGNWVTYASRIKAIPTT